MKYIFGGQIIVMFILVMIGLFITSSIPVIIICSLVLELFFILSIESTNDAENAANIQAIRQKQAMDYLREREDHKDD